MRAHLTTINFPAATPPISVEADDVDQNFNTRTASSSLKRILQGFLKFRHIYIVYRRVTGSKCLEPKS